jgi:hypothetical protein
VTSFIQQPCLHTQGHSSQRSSHYPSVAHVGFKTENRTKFFHLSINEKIYKTDQAAYKICLLQHLTEQTGETKKKLQTCTGEQWNLPTEMSTCFIRPSWRMPVRFLETGLTVSCQTFNSSLLNTIFQSHSILYKIFR